MRSAGGIVVERGGTQNIYACDYKRPMPKDKSRQDKMADAMKIPIFLDSSSN